MIPEKLQFFDILVQFDITDLKRQLGSDHPERIHYSGKPFGANQRERLCPLRVPHGQQDPGQTAYMIPVIVGKGNHINRLKAPALFTDSYLRSFAAVYQNT